MAQLPLETARLILRPYAHDDADAIAALLDDPAMADFLMVIPRPFVAFDARQLVKAAWRRLTTGRGFDLLMAPRDGDGQPVGSVGVGLHDEGQRAELGFWVGREFWGQGYASEATERMVRFVREVLLTPRITATASVGNAGSLRVLEKLGFSEFGRDAKTVPSTGEARPVILFELIGRP